MKTQKHELPSEIIEDIFSRLPVKSILRFRSLSKPSLSLLSNPSFAKLHFARPHRTAFFFSAYDYSSHKHHLLTAPLDGGPLTLLTTLDYDPYPDHDGSTILVQHLNGLLCFSSMAFDHKTIHNFLINPTMHQIFKLPADQCYVTETTYTYRNLCYLFGFNESTNEHKILNFRKRISVADPTAMEVFIFSVSDYSWRMIVADPPVGFTWEFESLLIDVEHSVCVNSVVHLMISGSFDILAFDLCTEKFSIINTPLGVTPHEDDTKYIAKNGETSWKENNPRVMKVNGCVGVVCHDRVVETNEMRIWILQDYEKRVWVREIITFPEPWVELGEPFPEDSISTDEIIFSNLDQVSVSSNNFFGNVMSALVYNRKSKCFKSLQFTSGHQFPLPRTLRFDHIRCYFESMMPL